ncbi:hypothetical protein HO173_009728 [Letharia columbiana]|uniref:Uncharacterized protein n=1 Tax=Letharia columbiana TaxID=112416 RepID=A0A8H6FP70_9LECA|nr:uncharacterized protein HO173_009728 [Letharia columbiana]KAF6232134.1 hypothetical protein HO173_009728 [Letharia columbiana]
MSDALIFEYLCSPRSSKRGTQAFHHNHPIMDSSPSSSNNHSDVRAPISSKGGESKRGSLNWIRGMGRKA